ncbi:hypothetical protein [uncultured Methanobrevibacter sp.]|uniref:hypothetical protein n=1 Tax=uncultured Methanobrevibacter sp. TaxID=253161 RepID=UPI0025F78549|nr:hypothetical protein [uncultured Methanobrevibacter sp.]
MENIKHSIIIWKKLTSIYLPASIDFKTILSINNKYPKMDKIKVIATIYCELNFNFPLMFKFSKSRLDK